MKLPFERQFENLVWVSCLLSRNAIQLTRRYITFCVPFLIHQEYIATIFSIIKKGGEMAKPISVTPVLRGEEAKKFLSKVNSAASTVKQESIPTPRANVVISRILADAGIR